MQDDQSVALSALLGIHARSEEPAVLLEQIRIAVAGVPHLEAKWGHTSTLRRPRLSRHHIASACESGTYVMRQKWNSGDEFGRKASSGCKLTLRRSQSGITPAEGLVDRNIQYLHGETAKLSKRSNSRWSVSRWRLLELDFGHEVAEAYRNYCVVYWRMYRPQLRSEMGGDSRSTPGAVIIGLSGLSIEASANPAWATKLNADEAVIAVRYALWELNQLPDWFGTLFAALPAPVKEVLLHEMAWELSQPRTANSAACILFHGCAGLLPTLPRPCGTTSCNCLAPIRQRMRWRWLRR